MKFKAILIIAANFLVTSMNAQHQVSVVIPNIKSIEGNMMVCLVQDKGQFLDGCETGQQIEVKSSAMTVVFNDVADGEYAISLFQDKDKDGELSTNLVGIPKEPFGFSNNPTIIFGPPSFEKCLFEVKGNTEVTVKL